MGATVSNVEAAEPDCFVWRPKGVALEIRLTYAVIDALAVEANARSGLAGLLLGKQTAEGVLISDFLLVRDEPLRTWLAGAGQGVYDEIGNRAGHGVTAVGVYRTHGGDRLAMSQQDVALMATFFAEPWNVFLLIGGPIYNEPPKAGFFFWDDGTILTDGVLLEFPFDSRLLRHSAGTYQGAIVNGPQGMSEFTPAPTVRHRQTRGRRLLAYWPFAVPVAAVALIMGSGADWRSRLTDAHQRQPTAEQAPGVLLRQPMDFQVEARSTDLRVTWDSASPALRRARIGVLTIVDGPTTREIPLTGSQLRTGNATYKPETEQIELRLEVFGEDGRRESEEAVAIWSRNAAPVRVAAVPAPARASTPTPAPAESSGAADRRSSPPERVRLVPVPYPVPVSPASLPEPPPVRAATVADRPPTVSIAGNRSRPVAGPPVDRAPAATRAAPTAAPARAAAAPAAVTPPSTPRLGVPRALPAASVRENSGRSATPAGGTAEAAKPLASRAAALPFVAARAVRQVSPVVPQSLWSLQRSDLDVAIKVTVDEHGDVVGAEPVDVKDGVGRMFAMPAIAAAKSWKFEPARRGGQPVLSELTVKFRFSKSR